MNEDKIQKIEFSQSHRIDWAIYRIQSGLRPKPAPGAPYDIRDSITDLRALWQQWVDWPSKAWKQQDNIFEEHYPGAKSDDWSSLCYFSSF